MQAGLPIATQTTTLPKPIISTPSQGVTPPPAISSSALRISQVRYGLHPDKARVVLDLVAPPTSQGLPSYTIGTTPHRITLHIGATATSWAIEPKDAVIQKLQLVPIGTNTADLIIETTVTVKRIEDIFLNNPDRLVLDLFP
jgi:hypothetical protein